MQAALRRLRDRPWVLTPLVATLRAAAAAGLPVREALYRHVPYRGVVRVQVPGGGSFQIHSSGHQIENGLYWEGLYAHEPGSMRTWTARAATAGTVLDIGANSGVFALAAAAMGARAVHAFEPLPRIHAVLAANAALNAFPNLHTWQVAVGDAPGVAALYDPGGAVPTSASLSAAFSRKHFGNLPSLEVQVISVDQFCTEHALEGVDLIKLDVEGHEEFALRGMRATVLRDRPAILMEVLPDYDAPLRALTTELFGGTYTWLPVDEGGVGPNRNVLLVPASAAGGA